MISEENASRIRQIYCESLVVNFKYDQSFQYAFKDQVKRRRGDSESKKLAMCASAFDEWCKTPRGSVALSVVKQRCPAPIAKEVLAAAEDSAVKHLLAFLR